MFKYLVLNITKHVQNLYAPIKEVKGDLNKWRDMPWLWIGRISIFMSILLKLT